MEGSAKLMKRLLSELAAAVDGDLVGPDREIEGFCSIREERDRAATHLSFWLPQRPIAELLGSQVQSVLVAKLPDPPGPERDALAGRSFVVVANPEFAFAQLLNLVHPQARAQEHDVHPSAQVAEDVIFDGAVQVGPLAVIESGVRIGAGSVIGARVFLGQNSQLGADVLLHPGCVIYEDSVLGDRVILHSGVVLGADGFGYAADRGRWVKIPQVGRVVIEDDVEIGARSCVDRAALSETRVRQGTKIDDLCLVAHNCDIGEHVAMAGCSGIAGSTRIGSYCRLGGQVSVGDHLELPAGTVVAGGSGVLHRIEEAGIYSGMPALPQRLRNRIYIEEQRLPDYGRRLHRLEQRIAELES
jgi:UDP-3-O-[3-hydroxymyristoyl] glucosamine N-acyltransferase